MVAYYEIFGRKVGSHVLSMATMGTIAGGVWLSTRGGGAPKKTEQGPPIAASSKDEENFIQDFLKSADGGDKKDAKH
ncbi:hypothetical protein PHISCL_00243 [Aspergillus sclerotialis]|uniref:ATP synthase subunit K n=1 Tax=Aspergillus sclerotialis TaxID=2070753 RepID=A0A3A3A1B8_9EURO|nr:hypothetical protein PHISCL_00243 [Aspergillus sclerotialis]